MFVRETKVALLHPIVPCAFLGNPTSKGLLDRKHCEIFRMLHSLHYIVSDNAEVMHHPEVGVSDSDAGAKSNIHRRLRHNPRGVYWVGNLRIGFLGQP